MTSITIKGHQWKSNDIKDILSCGKLSNSKKICYKAQHSLSNKFTHPHRHFSITNYILKLKITFYLNLLRFARLPEVCVWCPPPIVRDLGKSTEEEKNDPIFWKSTWIVSSDFKIHQLTQRFNVKTILFSFLCNFLHFRKRAHWHLVLIN